MSEDALPLLITVDVEIAHDRDLHKQVDALWRLAAQRPIMPATWFCTADAAERFAEPLRLLAQTGHTIGCHGLDHGEWEDYRLLSREQALSTLAEATDRIERAVGVRPRVFRGPRMTTSAATQDALRTLGYVADFSVCARRFDLMAASRFNRRWVTTGAAPYRPVRDDAFKPEGPARTGELAVIPLSGWGLPLVSGSLYLLGHKLTQGLARTMTRVAWRARAPVVYLFHSYEFVDVSGPVDHRPLHHRLYPASAEARFQLNHRFLASLTTRHGLEPVSADQYIGGWLHDANEYQAHDHDHGRTGLWPGQRRRQGRRAHAGAGDARPAEHPSLARSLDQLQIGDAGGCAADEDTPVHHPLR